MFDSEDFDLDEDFLNDIGQKEEEYYSQKIESESNSPKRRKTEEIDFLSDTSFDDELDFAKFSSKSVEPAPETSENSEVSQKKTITEDKSTKSEPVRNESNWKIPNFGQNTGKSSQVLAKRESNDNVEISRRTLALEILRKGSAAQEAVPIEKSSNSLSTRLNPLTPILSHGERNCRIDDEQARRKTLLESFKKPYPKVSKSPMKFGATNSNASSTRSNPQTPISSYSEKSSRFDDSDEQTRRKKLLESFKKPYPKGTKSPGIYGEITSKKSLAKDRSLAVPRVTLVRKFPGPAGLLPDCPELNFENGNLLNRVDDCNIEVPDDTDDSEMSEYFSQNTEKLFSAGAWRLMLDDLPNGFLRGHEIATIKKTAKSNSRVSLLAGVIARIDLTRQNPRLILKDMSDSIAATMHPDILLAHPNTFEPGVVVFLRHVGVLGFQTSPILPTLQFHVMIAAKNIVAVYSEKSRVVTSPWMETILGNTDNYSEAKKSPTRQIEDEIIDENIENGRNFSMAEDNIDMSGFESDDDDTFASFNIDDLADSQSGPSSSKFPSKNSVNLLETDKKVQNNEIKMMVKQSEVNPSSKRLTNEFVTKQCSSAISIKENSRESSIVTNPKKIEALRSKLMQFRSKDDTRSQIRENVDESCPPDKQLDVSVEEDYQDENNPSSTGFGDNLMDSDNDTEDEILSQLDVDSIVTSYNSQT